MKLNVLAVLVVASATGSLMSMDQKKQRLNFRLNYNALTLETEIKSYSNENMDFMVKPEDFLGKSILHAVPLNQSDRAAIALGLAKALGNKETVKVPYSLDQKNFMATITALETKNKMRPEYFIKCTPSK